MPPKRPGPVSTIAILGIVLGALGIASSLSSLASLVFQGDLESFQMSAAFPEAQRELSANMSASMMEVNREMRPLMWVGAPLNLLTSILLVIGGVLALKPKPDAMKLLLFVTAPAALVDLYSGAVSIVLTRRMGPAMEGLGESLAGNAAESEALGTFMELGMLAAVVMTGITVLCKLAYYVTAAIVLTRPKVKAWYRGEASA